MRRLIKYYLGYVLLLLLQTQVFAAQLEMQVIQLHQKTAADLIPVIKPLLPEGSAVSGTAYELIIKAPPEVQQQLGPVIAKLDQAPKNLIISIRRAHNAGHDLKSESKTKVTVYTTTNRIDRDQAKSILVQDGQAAYIATGEEFPTRPENYLNFSLYPVNNLPPEYKKLNSGFYVTPRLQDQQVVLNISWDFQQLQQNRDDWQRRKSPITNEQTQTRVTIPLGEWYDLSNASTRFLRADDRTLYDTADLKNPDSSLYIKVDLKPNQQRNRVTYPQGKFHSQTNSPLYP